MKIVLIGATGTIGKEVAKVLNGNGLEVIPVGRSGEFSADISSRESLKKLFTRIGKFDSIVNAAGDVTFAPLEKLGEKEWLFSFSNKLMGQINVAQESVPFLNDGGSITLVSGVLTKEPIFAGSAASTVNGALEAFTVASAIELPRGIRINIVSPTVLKESEKTHGPFFPGMIPVSGERVAQAFKRSVLGRQTGQVYEVFG